SSGDERARAARAARGNAAERAVRGAPAGCRMTPSVDTSFVDPAHVDASHIEILTIGFDAHEPPEAHGLRRDGVRLMVSMPGRDPVHARFTDLPRFLRSEERRVGKECRCRWSSCVVKR